MQKYLLEDTSQQKDAFAELCGWNGSLKYQVELAKSAISYPPKGLHTLILGDSGVGKSAFAKAMHEYGKNYYKEDYPLVTFNCADYGSNPQLLLSQLFGHVKNAFTGADKDKIGLVEKANGGILFLDEVHRLPPEGQEMLFYLMDKGEYNRLGDTTYRKSKVLIIAATTSTPDKVLLKTFTRRIPIIINLPLYKDRPILEKIMIIEKFLYDEALAINKILYVEPIIFKALTEATYSEGNVGQLISDIKLLCARAYYAYIQGENVIKLD
ncbi:sigma 54-interacting transcriptional regulator, partial [uncultured Megamonas sp.]